MLAGISQLLAEITQSAAPKSFDLSGTVVSAAGVIVLALQGWMVKTLRDVTKQMEGTRVALFGMNNDNGLNSNVKQNRERLHQHGNTLQAHEFRLDRGGHRRFAGPIPERFAPVSSSRREEINTSN